MMKFLIGIGGAAFAVCMVLVVFVALRMMWNSIAKPFPPQPEEDDAVSKSYQSASIGIFNLGFCVGITVDSAHMHLKPNFILQLTTRRSMSIPWSEIKPGKYSFFKRYRSFKLANNTITLPTWAVDLAEPDAVGNSDE